MKKRNSSFIFLLLLISTPLTGSAAWSSSIFSHTNAALSMIPPAGLQVYVTDESNGLPVPGAHIQIPALSMEVWTDHAGTFSQPDILLEGPAIPITVTIQAEGYGEWTLQDVRLISGDTLAIEAALTSAPYLSIVTPPDPEKRNTWPDSQQEMLELLAVTPPPATLPQPQNIRVRVSGYPYHCDTKRTYQVEVVNFRDYVKHVLPNEWGLWPAESLRAGAIAVKMYALYMIALGGKWSDADVWDSTCDQVYNPNFSYTSMNEAVDYVWNHILSRKNEFFPTYYRAYYYQCEASNLAGSCMGQWDSKALAEEGYTWDQILSTFYVDTDLTLVKPPAVNGYNLRFNGNAADYRENRVLIPIDDPATITSGPPIDIGAENFTIEWWMKTDQQKNTASAVICGANKNWVNGNILLDREITGLESGFGVSIAGGKLVFGVSNGSQGNQTLCSQKSVSDGAWHHIVVQRRISDGYLWLFVDGVMQASTDGPNGDLSYPDDQEMSLSTDPFLGIGAWKAEEEAALHPFFYGTLDEIRISNIIRYLQDFIPPSTPFSADKNTIALYHLDEGIGDLITDSSNNPAGLSHGSRETGSPSLGGDPILGSEWAVSDLFLKFFVPLVSKQP